MPDETKQAAREIAIAKAIQDAAVEIVEMARAGEIDGDFRSIRYRIQKLDVPQIIGGIPREQP